ncbi:MAG: hypothetical protein E7J49_08605 [Finegoldia magna]|jgi:hypothetical protein|uniref:hypothetical protein n=1 Tax=Finegoldia magna TaxID=1260 RepID=UPI002051581D|nr:hypothetical protein [Finegoldia magna]MDU7891250.1 hypothetical protein [Finegoldia magna]DAW17257.1 MAG TPA: upper collar protein [Caudoviricetes sp.]
MNYLDNDFIGKNNNGGLKVELPEDIDRRIMEHRNRFRRLIFNRYVEFLPLLINYTNQKSVGIDFLQLEIALRQGYQVVVGKARNGVIMILGYIQSMYYKNGNDFINNFNLTFNRRLTQDDITFIIPEYLRPEYALEIEYYDNCQSGDFIVLRNKPININNDYKIIEHYCDELAEIILSRFSLIMQSKFSKIFLSDIQDETINQFINKLYNGAPFIKTDHYIDPLEDIIDLGSDFVTTALVEMKREYQNKVSELSNFLGVNSLAVDKESGVSDTEAKSNRSFTTSNSNIYLRGRYPFEMLNRRFNLDIHAYYDDEAISEMDIMNLKTDNFGGGSSE